MGQCRRSGSKYSRRKERQEIAHQSRMGGVLGCVPRLLCVHDTVCHRALSVGLRTRSSQYAPRSSPCWWRIRHCCIPLSIQSLACYLGGSLRPRLDLEPSSTMGASRLGTPYLDRHSFTRDRLLSDTISFPRIRVSFPVWYSVEQHVVHVHQLRSPCRRLGDHSLQEIQNKGCVKIGVYE